jgi:CRISPR system Cascade subunit CasD
MRDVLLFVLQAPLAALGDVAVGERRYGIDRPAKSAVLGVVAAALGIERRDEAAHAALHRDYSCAVQVASAGRLLEDYHTAQVPPARRGRSWATRREELAEPRLETILSLRDYRTDARYGIVLWARPDARWPLADLAEALRRPAFTLYLGRKCCPLGRPPAPLLHPAATLAEAFVALDAAEQQRGVVDAGLAGPVFADLDAAAWIGTGLRRDRIIRRRDRLVSRRRWQFELRDELVLLPIGEEPAS